jgi:UDP-3-O-[3-hydroxymyristoyl] N-acetylglucosamine deacetylase
MKIIPADEDSGIAFLKDGRVIPADTDHLVTSPWMRCTSLQMDGVVVHSVEHVLSALWGMGVDNARVIVEGPEAPMLGNSTYVIAAGIQHVGLSEQVIARRYLNLSHIVGVGEEGAEGEACIYALPAWEKTIYTYKGDYPAPVGKGTVRHRESSRDYLEDLSRARTFVELKDLRKQRKEGFSKGSTKDNCLIYHARTEGWVSDALPTTDDEPIRHKVIDMIGDLALIGRRVHAHFIGYKTGHSLQVRVAHKLRAMLR